MARIRRVQCYGGIPFSFEDTMIIKGVEVDIEVSGMYTPGSKGNRDEPPDSGDADIESIIRLDDRTEVPDKDFTVGQQKYLAQRAYEEGGSQSMDSAYDGPDYEKDEDY